MEREKFYTFRYVIVGLCLLGSFVSADITGTVFRDLPVDVNETNTYGIKDTNEFGIANIQINGVDESGNVASAVTDSSGAYTLTGLSGKVRVTFSGWPDYLKESVDQKNKNSSVRFVLDGESGVDLALHYPSDFSRTATPDMASLVQINGYNSGDVKSVLKFNYKSGGITGADGITSRADELIDNSIGSLWGLAYRSDTKSLYSAAFLKRHVALGDGGLGAIYVTKGVDSDTPVTSLFATIPNVGTIGSNEDRDINASVGVDDPSHDNEAYGKIAKVGLGDIDLSDDAKTLYVVNLNDKHLYSVDIASKTTTDRGIIPDPGCSGGEWRPFGLKYHEGDLYVGGVCDAQNSQNRDDLKAVVYRYDGSAYNNILEVPLNYDKVSATDEDGNTSRTGSKWHPWKDTRINTSDSTERYPEPVLSDIEFDEYGDIYLGFLDRFGHQTGHKNYMYQSDNTYEAVIAAGDILKACLDASGNYILENNGVCGGETGAGADNNFSGPGGSEFFDDRFYRNHPDYPERGHAETSNGAIAVLPGSGEIVLNSMDPVNHPEDDDQHNNYFRAGGPAWYISRGDDAGKKRKAFQLFWDASLSDAGFGKGHALGDLELLTEAAPVEIGNRLWIDTNKDGIQDPDEMPLEGVLVQLLDVNGTLLAEVTTNASGLYIFSNDPYGADEAGYEYNISGLIADANYTIRIPNATGEQKQDVLKGLYLTTSNSGIDDEIDSDGKLDGVDAVAEVYPSDIPYSGANNHSFDFGFYPVLTLGSVVWLDENDNGIQESSERGIANLTVALLDENSNPVLDSSGNAITTKTDGNGTYFFDELEPGTYRIKVTGDTLSRYRASSVQESNANNNNPSDSNIESGDGSSGFVSAPIALALNDEPYGSSEESNLPNSGDSQDQNSDTDFKDKNGNMTLDIGIYTPQMSLGSVVWLDNDVDGLQGSGETGISGVTLRILDENNQTVFDVYGHEVASVTSDSSGRYFFENLSEGTYHVEINMSSYPNYVPTLQNGNADDNDPDDSNIVHEDNVNKIYYSATITLSDQDEPADSEEVSSLPNNGDSMDDSADKNGNMTLDFGFYEQLVSLGSVIWIDEDKDGLQDSDEVGLEGVTVELLDGDGNVVTDSSGNAITTVTDGNGTYYFGDLQAGTYKIRVSGSVLNDYIPTIQQNDANSNNAEDSNLDNNYTYKQSSYTSAAITLLPKTEPVENSEKSELSYGGDNQDDTGFNADNSGNMTLDIGFKRIIMTLGSLIWLDENYGNNDAKQDAGEQGIPGIGVRLLNEDGTPAHDWDGKELHTVTDENGIYFFGNLKEGAYIVEINTSAYPGYYGATNTGSAAPFEITFLDIYEESDKPDDSDINPTNSDEDNGIYRSYKVTLELEQEPKDDFEKSNITPNGDNADDTDDTNGNMTIDFGLANSGRVYSIGSYVWADLNDNGIQDDGNQSGIEGVEVVLLDENGTEINSTTTDENGTYYFGHLEAGTYRVRVSGNALDGYSPSSIQNSNADDDNATDSNIESIENNGYLSAPISLSYHGEPDGGSESAIGDDKDDGSDDTNGNMTLDFGFSTKAALGNYVWYDDNHNGLQERNESGVANVEVILLDDSGNEVNRTRTDSDGKYIFMGLTPGTYSVEFNLSTLPEDYRVTTANVGTDDTNDSDADPNDGMTQSVTLNPGDTNLTLDMGIYIEDRPASLGDRVWVDMNENGLQDPGEANVSGVVVILLDSMSLTVPSPMRMEATSLQGLSRAPTK